MITVKGKYTSADVYTGKADETTIVKHILPLYNFKAR